MAMQNKDVEIYFRIEGKLYLVGNYANVDNLLPNIYSKNNIILEPYGYNIYFEGSIGDGTFKTYIEVEKVLQGREMKNIMFEVKYDNEFLTYAKGNYISDLSLNISDDKFSARVTLMK